MGGWDNTAIRNQTHPLTDPRSLSNNTGKRRDGARGPVMRVNTILNWAIDCDDQI